MLFCDWLHHFTIGSKFCVALNAYRKNHVSQDPFYSTENNDWLKYVIYITWVSSHPMQHTVCHVQWRNWPWDWKWPRIPTVTTHCYTTQFNPCCSTVWYKHERVRSSTKVISWLWGQIYWFTQPFSCSSFTSKDLVQIPKLIINNFPYLMVELLFQVSQISCAHFLFAWLFCISVHTRDMIPE